MTEFKIEDFIAYASLPDNIVNVNVWYTGSAPNSVILGVAVPVLDDLGQDHTEVFQGLQQIAIPTPTPGTTVLLDILTSQVITIGIPPTSSYLFTVIPTPTPDITGDFSNGDLVFSPDSSVAVFNASPYNTIGGLVDFNRESLQVMKVDRKKVGGVGLPSGYTGPNNIYSIISESADKAHIQDSNYSITGWSNGRYNGSKTSILEYNIEPATSGKIFQAAPFGKSIPNSVILSQASQNQVQYLSYFYAGIEESPGVEYEDSLTTISGSSVYSSDSNVFFVKTTLSKIPDPSYLPLSLGQIIRVSSNSTINATLGELMKITAIGKRTGAPSNEYTLLVIRNLRGTTAGADTQVNDRWIDSARKVNIFQVIKNKLVPAASGKLLLKETNNIIEIDKKGLITSGSL